MTELNEKSTPEVVRHPSNSTESTLYPGGSPAQASPAAIATKTPATMGGAPQVSNSTVNQEDISPMKEEENEAPLEQTPSRAQRIGKKKITVIMIALCVRLLSPTSKSIITHGLPMLTLL